MQARWAVGSTKTFAWLANACTDRSLLFESEHLRHSLLEEDHQLWVHVLVVIGYIEHVDRLVLECVRKDCYGTEADEVMVLHRPTGLLVLQDLISNNLTQPEARPFAGRLKYFAFDLIDRIGWLSYHPTLWRLASLQACLQRVASAPYTLVTGAHWPVSPCDRPGFDAALECALALSPLQHKRLVARYFWQQPGFLVDFVRYAVKSA